MASLSFSFAPGSVMGTQDITSFSFTPDSGSAVIKTTGITCEPLIYGGVEENNGNLIGLGSVSYNNSSLNLYVLSAGDYTIKENGSAIYILKASADSSCSPYPYKAQIYNYNSGNLLGTFESYCLVVSDHGTFPQYITTGTFYDGVTSFNNAYPVSSVTYRIAVNGSPSSSYSATYDGNVRVISFESSDNGSTWQQVTSPVEWYVDGVAVAGSPTTLSFTNAGSHLIGVNLAGSDPVMLNFEIVAIQLTISGTTVTSTRVYNGGVGCEATAGSLSGVLSDDIGDVAVTAEGVYNNKNYGTSKPVTVTYTLSGSKAGNYLAPEPDTTSFTASITKLRLKISGTTVANKSYDGTTTASATVGQLTNVCTDDTVNVAVSSATFADKNVGTKNVTVVYSISGNTSNYYKPVNGTLKANITAVGLTITPATISGFSNKVYDGAVLSTATISGGSVSGFVGNETATLTTSALYSPALSKNYGTYGVSVNYGLTPASGTVLSNYSYTFPTTSASASISKRPISISNIQSQSN